MPCPRLLILHLCSDLVYSAQAEPVAAELLYVFPVFPDEANLEPEAWPKAIFTGMATGQEDRGDDFFRVAAGDYFFCQWGSEDVANIEAGLAAFTESVKKDGRKTKGPWMLRVLAEDGGTRFQGLKGISA